MKRIAVFSSITLLAITLAGCVSDPMGRNGWQGFSPNGDYDLIGVDATLTTPWGTQHLHADRLSKRNDPLGTNGLAALPQPPVATNTLSGTTTITPSK